MRFFGRIQKRICDLDHTDSSLPKKKPEDPEKDHLPWQRTYPRATSETKKKQQTDPHGEDKKKKQHKLWMNIYEMFILRFETQMFLEYNTLLRIVKL